MIGIAPYEMDRMLRAARRFHFAAAQDTHPVVAFLHNSYSVAIMDMLRELATDDEVLRATGTDSRAMRGEMLALQDRLQATGERMAKQSGLAGLGQAAVPFPSAAPNIPMSSTNRLLALPAALVFYRDLEELKQPQNIAMSAEGPYPANWMPPQSQCPWPWDVKKVIWTKSDPYKAAFAAYMGGASVQSAFDPLIGYACTGGVPINESSWITIPPFPGAPAWWHYNWWAYAFRCVVAQPTTEESKALARVALYSRNNAYSGPNGTLNLYAETGIPYPNEIFPPGHLGAEANPPPFSDYAPYLENLATLQSAVESYPWPGPRMFFWKAWMESNSAGANELVLRKGDPRPSADWFRTLITLGIIEHWAKIADRVNAMAKSFEREEKRELAMKMYAIAVVGVVAAIFTGGIALAAISTALTGLSAVEKQQAAKQMADFAASFEKDQPAFAAEVRRVMAELGLDKVTAAPEAAGAGAPAGGAAQLALPIALAVLAFMGKG